MIIQQTSALVRFGQTDGKTDGDLEGEKGAVERGYRPGEVAVFGFGFAGWGWDFEGDGIYDTSFSSDLTTEHTFFTAGAYSLTVQVRDAAGNSAVHEVEDSAPVHKEAVILALAKRHLFLPFQMNQWARGATCGDTDCLA